MTSKIRVKSNCDIIAIFSLILCNSEFSMKIKFPSYATRKNKIPELHNSGILSFMKNSELLH